MSILTWPLLLLALLPSACATEAAGQLCDFVLPWDDGAPGPTDLSAWNHTPAGKFGSIRAAADGHLYAGDQRQRFWGVNLCFGANIPDKADAPLIAGRMAKFGINIVRIHHFDGMAFPRGIWTPASGASPAPATPPASGDATRATPGPVLGASEPSFSPDALDRFDFFTSQFKARGIYLNLNLLVSRKFSTADGLPSEIKQVTGKANHLLGFFYAPALALHQKYARDLLTHRNPYTGLTYAEDPAVAFVELINENGIVNYWFDQKRQPFLRDLPGVFGQALTAKWNAFLRARYGSTVKLTAAWGQVEGALEGDTVKPLARDGFAALPVATQRDWIDYLCDLERSYAVTMRDYLRKDLGLKALIMGSTCASSTLEAQAGLDAIDGHVYWENPRFRKRQWDYAGLDWSVSNTSHVNEGPGGRLRWLAMYRVAGKPFSITEFNHSAPNVFAGEAPLYLALHGAVQDWDALYLFAYEHSSDWRKPFLMGLNLNAHPTKMVNMLAAAALFRRADLSPSAAIRTVYLPAARERELIRTKGRPWNLANGAEVGLDGDEILSHQLQVQLSASPAGWVQPAKVLTPALARSESGEVTWDNTQPGGAVYVLDTARTKCVFGMTAGRCFDLGGVQFDVGQTIDGGATLSLVLTDGASFAAPRKAVLIATARAMNTGMAFKPVNEPMGAAPKPRWELTTWGKPPTQVEVVPATITVPTAGRRVIVRALDERGQPAATVVALISLADRVRFSIGPPAATLWYEITWD